MRAVGDRRRPCKTRRRCPSTQSTVPSAMRTCRDARRQRCSADPWRWAGRRGDGALTHRRTALATERAGFWPRPPGAWAHAAWAPPLSPANPTHLQLLPHTLRQSPLAGPFEGVAGGTRSRPHAPRTLTRNRARRRHSLSLGAACATCANTVFLPDQVMVESTSQGKVTDVTVYLPLPANAAVSIDTLSPDGPSCFLQYSNSVHGPFIPHFFKRPRGRRGSVLPGPPRDTFPFLPLLLCPSHALAVAASINLPFLSRAGHCRTVLHVARGPKIKRNQ
eukprot:364694-Chlamydomonas_euryale.AAC.5